MNKEIKIMKRTMMSKSAGAVLVMCAMANVPQVLAQATSPKYKADVPKAILTPDSRPPSD